MIVGMSVVVFLGQDDFAGLNRLVHSSQVLRVEVFVVVHASKILGKVLVLHSLVLHVAVVLVGVEHNDCVGEDVDGIFVRNIFWLCHVHVLISEPFYNALNEC
jgi:hypothetical protein